MSEEVKAPSDKELVETAEQTNKDKYYDTFKGKWRKKYKKNGKLTEEYYLHELTHLQEELQNRGAWFGTAGQVVRWFRRRRSVVFEECSWRANTLHLHLKHDGCGSQARLFLRIHRPRKAGSAGAYAESDYFDVPWNGESSLEVSLD